MTNIEMLERFDEIVDGMKQLHKDKNADYGDSFGKSWAKHGPKAYLIRAEDKWNRINELMETPSKTKVKSESVIDTLIDLAVYSIKAAIEVEKMQAQERTDNKFVEEMLENEFAKNGRNEIPAAVAEAFDGAFDKSRHMTRSEQIVNDAKAMFGEVSGTLADDRGETNG